jgi:HEAT repeat protein
VVQYTHEIPLRFGKDRNMMGRCLLPLLAVLAIAAPLAAQPDADTAADEKLLQSAHLKTDGPSLNKFFHQRATVADQKKLESLVSQLTEAKGALGDQTIGELVAIGPAAVPLLKEAISKKPGPEPLLRLKKCLDWLEGQARYAIPAAAARLLAVRKPAGAVEALLAYAAGAEADGVSLEIRDALAALARRGGKIDPALVAGLADKEPLRRAMAAEALVQIRAWEHVPAIRRLLTDTDGGVRLRVALGLNEARDGEAIPVLLASLEHLSLSKGRQAEEALTHLAGAFAPKVPLRVDEPSRKGCRAAWSDWWKESDGSAMPDYFRRRTLSDVTKVAALIRALGHASHPVREKATAELIAQRRLAAPLLKAALADPDPEIQRRSRICLEQIALAAEAPRSVLNVKLLVLRHPSDATELLLDFLPFADDDSVEEEIRNALISLAQRDSRNHKALLARLDDKFAQRRGPAAEALAQSGTDEHRKLVRNRLRDADPTVRLRAAVALAIQQEKDAIPVLIALLGELPLGQAREAEGVLHRLGGKQKCLDAWTDWWKQNADRADLARLQRSNRLLGYTILARWNYRDNINEIVEIGLGGEVRWKIENLGYSFDFQILPNNRLLIAENNKNVVTERTFKGDILWEYKITHPHNCQRLPNGNTFIATGSELIELDRQSNIVYKISFSNMSACKLTDGRILAIPSSGNATWLDATGKQLKTVQITTGVSSYGCLEALPRGGALLCLYNDNKVVEFDAEGKTRWEAKLPNPFMAVRLPNGNTMVTSQSAKSAVEVDAVGNEVWAHRPDMAIWRARRR